jgi:hypothetical protein
MVEAGTTLMTRIVLFICDLEHSNCLIYVGLNQTNRLTFIIHFSGYCHLLYLQLISA